MFLGLFSYTLVRSCFWIDSGSLGLHVFYGSLSLLFPGSIKTRWAQFRFVCRVCFQVIFFSEVWVEILIVGPRNARFCYSRSCKNHVSAKVDSWWLYGWFLEAFGVVSLTFVALEAGLQMECFSKVILRVLNGTREYRRWRINSNNCAFDPH